MAHLPAPTLQERHAAPDNSWDEGGEHDTHARDDDQAPHDESERLATIAAHAHAHAHAAAVATAPVSGKRPRGKPIHAVWALFTDEPDAHKLTSGDAAACRHCRATVRHHNKVVSVMTHLRRCHAFAVVAQGMQESERPEWLTAGRGWRQHCTTKNKKSKTSDNGTVETEIVMVAQDAERAAKAIAGTNAAASASASGAMRAVSKERPSRDTKKLPVQVASPSSSSSSSSSPFPQALPPVSYQVVRTQVAELLTYSSYASVIAAYDEADTTTTKGDATSGVSTVNYSVAVPGAKVLFLEAVERTGSISSTSTGEEEDKGAQWIAQDLARVIESLGGARTVCGAVMSSNSPVHQQARKLLKQTFPASFFHGCARESLQSLVESVFGAVGSGGEDGESIAVAPSSAFLSTFTDGCRQMVAFFLDSDDCEDATRRLLLEYQQRSNVTPLKSFGSHGSSIGNNNSSSDSNIGNLASFFYALRGNAAILDKIVSERSDFVSTGSAAERERAMAAIQGILSKRANFVANLDKAIAILEPIRSFADKLESSSSTGSTTTATTIVASDVYQAFVGLPGLFGESDKLTPREKSHLVAVCSKCFDAMNGDALALANLLDPRFLGDGMSRDTQAAVEDLLFTFPSDETDDNSGKNGGGDEEASEAHQEAIYTQYTEFRVASLAERNKQSFRFKMLMKGRKSALQFWQSDGTFWPELQTIALKVFSMAVVAAPVK